LLRLWLLNVNSIRIFRNNVDNNHSIFSSNDSKIFLLNINFCLKNDSFRRLYIAIYRSDIDCLKYLLFRISLFYFLLRSKILMIEFDSWMNLWRSFKTKMYEKCRVIIIIDHTWFNVDFSRLMRKHLCKIFIKEKSLKKRKFSLYASSERSHWVNYSTYYVFILLYLWLLFLLS
jgi:hypothetical protein